MKKVLHKILWSIICITFLLLIVPLKPAHTYASTTDLSEISPDQIPAVFGGNLHGIKQSQETVNGYGTIYVKLNYDTGDMRITNFDGSTTTTTLLDVVNKDMELIQNATPEQVRYLQSISENRISVHDVCPYLVGVIGTAHGLTWGKVLALAAVHPAIAVLEALGESVFWTWVSSHC